MFPSRFEHLDVARARFGDRVDRLGPYLMRVDDAADAVVREMDALPPRRGWELFSRALARGIDAAPEAPEAMRALFAEVDEVPVWVDWDLLDRGGEILMRAGIYGGIVLGAKSLVHGYLSPGGNKPLVFSGRLTEQAQRRLDETSRFVQAVCRPGGMRRHGDGFAITLQVRIMHARVRRMILQSGRWDAARWGMPINQHDMAGTTLLFSSAVIEGLRMLGIRVSEEEADAYHHLWRYVGRLSGVDRGILPTSSLEARRLAELIAATLGQPDDDSRALTRALLGSALSVAKTPAERRHGQRTKQLGGAFVRHLMGDEAADALGLPRTRWRHVVDAMRRFAIAAEQIRTRFPAAHRAAVAEGTRYWDRVVELGLSRATIEFRPPESLAMAG